MEYTEEWAVCEQKYLECFCRRTKDGFFTRYADPASPEWNYANCLWLRKAVSPVLLRRTLSEKLAAARAAAAPQFSLNLAQSPAVLGDVLPAGGAALHEGAYVFSRGKAAAAAWAFSPEVEIRPLTAENAADLHTIDQCSPSAGWTAESLRRRTENRIDVFLRSPAMHCYLAYLDGRPAGKCCLFLSGSAARLENLRTVPEMRHRRIASTLFRALAQEAYEAGCQNLYLSADEEDTPKKMYEAMGFARICESWLITWQLS